MGRLGSVLQKPDVLLWYDMGVAQYLQEEATRQDALRHRELHASLLDDPFCVRCALDSAITPPQTYRHPTQRLLVFWDGRVRHEKWQELFRRMGWALAVERPYMLGPFICTPDAILDIQGERYVWECKGMRSTLWEEVRRRGSPPKAFIDRLHVYFLATGIRRGILHVENKDTGEYLTYLVEAEPERLREMKAKARQLAEAYRTWKRTGELPAHTCSNGRA